MDRKLNLSQKEEGHPIVPKKDLKCIWMTAGLISYKLCKYDLKCERCPLDWELRNLSSSPPFDSKPSEEVKRTISPGLVQAAPSKKEREGEEFLEEEVFLFNMSESLFYHPGHTWVKVEKADEVRVGLDDFLGRIMRGVKAVVLPLPGSQGFQGEHLCSIIQEEGLLDIVFPVRGLVLSVNQKLRDQPELITRDPLGDGFLLTLKPKNIEQDQKYLFWGEAALSWRQKEWERFKTAVVPELHPGEERIGMTMQDGEIKLRDLKGLIDPGRYIQLLNSFLRRGENILSRTRDNIGIDS